MEDFPNINFDSRRHIGYIAQEVAFVVPEIVYQNDSGFYSLDYGRMVSLLAEAIKDQQDSINALKNIIVNYENRFANIETMLTNCCQNTNARTTQSNSSDNSLVGSRQSSEFDNTEISSVIHITPDKSINSPVTELYQNRPNPFTTKTTFTYQLGKTGFVELEIHSELGAFIAKLVDMNQEEGSFSIDWNTADIAPGIYFYSLKVDGQLWVKKAVRIK